MQMMRIHFMISHATGKISNTLSQAPVRGSSFEDAQFNQQVAAYISLQ